MAEENLLFKTSAIGYDKDEVNDYCKQVSMEKQTLMQQLTTLQNSYNTLRSDTQTIRNTYEQTQKSIKELTDKNRELEYRLFKLNESYEDLQLRADALARVYTDAKLQSDSILEEARIKANDLYRQKEHDFLDNIDSSKLNEVDQYKLQYYKSRRNLLILKQAMLMLQNKVALAIDDIEHSELLLNDLD